MSHFNFTATLICHISNACYLIIVLFRSINFWILKSARKSKPKYKIKRAKISLTLFISYVLFFLQWNVCNLKEIANYEVVTSKI